MNKKIVLMICMLLISVGLLSGCVDDAVTVETKKIELLIYSEDYFFEYSSDGLRDAINKANYLYNHPEARISLPVAYLYIPEGNIITYATNNSDYCFYIDNMTNFRIRTAGLNETRFIVFGNEDVFVIDNISFSRFEDFNITLMNLHYNSSVLKFKSGCELNSFESFEIYNIYNHTKYWYDTIQYFYNKNPEVIV